MAPPMAGTCDVEIPPSISDTGKSSSGDCGVELSVRSQSCFEFLHTKSRLLGADVLDIQPKDPGKFRQVVDIAARCQQGEDTALFNRELLLLTQTKAIAVCDLILLEFLPVFRIVERI